ncbi:uncharacterized protein BJX67DRAFT_138005 [Aspergillus lucknowensis]|uniref:Life-span regulatory factor-domain-containing protein n=1 Tax=Aspergillus lucknowensis TaxID=176173 RepID=A0ABR4LPP7_9EURO
MAQSHAHYHHRRTLSGSNSSKLRTARPALHRKGASSANVSISKLGSGQLRTSVSDDDDRMPEMAASFLNYCAMCETQITVPDNRLLYCSERCRRKDSHKPLSASLSFCTTMSAPNSPPASPPASSCAIVAPMTPTKIPVNPPQSIRIPSDMHEAKTDLDPTEWKPVIPMDARYANVMASDAWKYLSRFHTNESVLPLRRARADHRSSASLSTLPSLSHTPSVASSASSVTSDDMTHHVHDPVHRPLPPRHKPYFSGSSSATKGVELVVPHVAVVPGSPIDMPNSGSIFPANSGLWNDKTVETSTAVQDT